LYCTLVYDVSYPTVRIDLSLRVKNSAAVHSRMIGSQDIQQSVLLEQPHDWVLSVVVVVVVVVVGRGFKGIVSGATRP